MRGVVWRIVGMVALGIGGLAVALALTLGALALAGDDLGSVVGPGGSNIERHVPAVESPSGDDERNETPSRGISSTPSPSPSRNDPDDDRSHDDSSGPGSGSDDSSGPGSDDGDSSGHGSGSEDSSGSGSGSDDHSDDDD